MRIVFRFGVYVFYSLSFLFLVMAFVMPYFKKIETEVVAKTVASLKEYTGLRNGDIIFQTSTSNQSKAIQLSTNSPYSHMGIIYEKNETFYVYEAVQPVKMTSLKAWIKRGEHEKYVVKRLRNAHEILTPEVLKKMIDIGNRFKGKNYDRYFEWSDDKMYCSELVWKIYQEATGVEIGRLQTLEAFD